MVYFLLYFVVIMFANTIGAVSGMGGGVIIKPALDAIGHHDLASINFYSSVAVFVMSIVSITKQVRGGFQIKIPQTLTIAIGSVLGGVLGNFLFQWLLQFFPTDNYVQLVQIILTVITLLFVFIYTRGTFGTFELTNLFWVFLVGLGLGTLSTLLGIGGGPINVSLLILCFSMSFKQATVYSIVTIFFSQLSKLVSIQLNEGIFAYDLTFLLPIIPAAILGGFLGSKLNQQLDNDKISVLFQIITLGVIFLNIYNGFRLFV